MIKQAAKLNRNFYSYIFVGWHLLTGIFYFCSQIK